jgi:hypothetical protein
MLICQSTSPTIDEITSALKQYEANEMGVKQECGDAALYSKGKGGGESRRRGNVDDGDEEFDWGNTKNHKGVCYRCGHPWHITQFCIMDMPDEVKQHILNHSANMAALDHNDSLFTFSDLALTKFSLDSINTSTAISTITQSIEDSPIATLKRRKKKKKIGVKKSELVEFTFFFFLFTLLLTFLMLPFHSF